MAYKSLRDFIEQLEADGDLVPITRPVSTHLEMTEIQRRLLAKKGPRLALTHKRLSLRICSRRSG
ncbi:hypothetical protein GCM10011367_12680 [Marinicauda pacifica]|uniref:3-octaprenyl-4-hydroxybenzoate carboxy-lyase-like N-terminal domain-containing protein n=1 Tax=Marinicauda pacifica TaxID=1133559 RepID=A0A4S2HFJ3_9PROT|nr:hypothetical protein E5162_06410 [Marinicauda pacifica]GGE39652.1 hypothetical protein GCM10011367_12680 [Marinicauda pacifica]